MSSIVSTLVRTAVLLLLAFRLSQAVVDPVHRRSYMSVIRAMRPRHLLVVPVVLAAVAAATAGLLQIPGLGFGWTSLIGLQGNAMLGLHSGDSGGLDLDATTVIILAVLVACLPRLVFLEEQQFRWGDETRRWPRRLAVALGFGLVHLTVGVPIAAGIALSLSGFAFSVEYRYQLRRCDQLTGPFDPVIAAQLERVDRLEQGLHSCRRWALDREPGTATRAGPGPVTATMTARVAVVVAEEIDDIDRTLRGLADDRRELLLIGRRELATTRTAGLHLVYDLVVIAAVAGLLAITA